MPPRFGRWDLRELGWSLVISTLACAGHTTCSSQNTEAGTVLAPITILIGTIRFIRVAVFAGQTQWLPAMTMAMALTRPARPWEMMAPAIRLALPPARSGLGAAIWIRGMARPLRT